MKTSESNPSDWFLLAKERLDSADALFAVRGACYSAVELLQESVERYLKGFLVSRGWQLERIHDLNRLLDLSTRHNCDFSAFQQLAQSLTEQFWAQHYPGEDSCATFDDPVIREVRDVRHRLAAHFGNDLGKVARDLMERQAIHGTRLLVRPPSH